MVLVGHDAVDVGAVDVDIDVDVDVVLVVALMLMLMLIYDGFVLFDVQVDEKMQVLTKEGGDVVPNLYCIGDANGKLMLAHAASAHGVR